MQKSFTLLEGRVEGILRFLRKTPMIYRGIRTHFAMLPWHLVIGTSGSGKTALLAHAGVRYVLAKKFSAKTLTAIPSSTTSEWWVTRDLVLVDTPGKWALWSGFLSLLKSKKTLKKLAGIVITLNLPELMQQGEVISFESHFKNLQNQIKQLRALTGHPLSCYLIITKCDLLKGFSAFFRDSSSEELSAAWGITLPPKNPKETLQESIKQRFNQLLKQLNNQLVLRLHQERDARLRPLIKNFPLEVEKLRDEIIQWLNRIELHLPLRGIWLTSALQSAVTPVKSKEWEQQGKHLLRSSFQMSDPFTKSPSKAFFIRQVIQNALPGFSVKCYHSQKKQRQRQVSLLAFLSVLFLGSATLLGLDFLKSISKTQTLEKNIQTYETIIHQTKPLLPTLQETLALVSTLEPDTLNQKTVLNAFPERILFYYSSKAEAAALKLHTQALKTLLLPVLAQPLNQQLKNGIHTLSPEHIYALLEARLMLAGEMPINARELLNTLTTLTPLKLDERNSRRFLSAINAIDSQGLKITNNPILIQKARQKLIRLPAWQLGMVLLENQMNTDNESLQLPERYTKERFGFIQQKAIPKAALESLQGNAVLGNFTPSKDRPKMAALISQITNRYQQQYAKVWLKKLHDLTLTKTTDLFATDALIAGFIDGNATEWQGLQSINENTNFSPILQINSAFIELNSLFADNPHNNQSKLYQVKTALNWLHQTIQQVITAHKPAKIAGEQINQALQAADKNPFIHLETVAELTPSPLNNWLSTLAMRSLQQMEEMTGEMSLKNHPLDIAIRQPKENDIKTVTIQHPVSLIEKVKTNPVIPSGLNLNLPKLNGSG